MAGIVTSGSLAKFLWPGLKAIWDKHPSYPEEYSRIFDVETDDRAYVETAGVSGLGLMSIKTQGSEVAYDDIEQNFVHRFTHVVYGKGMVITREMVEDDQYSVASNVRTTEMRASARITKETIFANILNHGFNSSYTMGSGSDAKELLATDHVSGPYGGTYQNELTNAADISEAALEDLIVLIGLATSPRGLRMMLLPQLLVVPVQLQFEASRLLDSSLTPATANNAINAVRQGKYIEAGFTVNHYLTDPDAWFIKPNCPEGLKCYNRRPLEFTSDNDFDTENAKFKVTERYSGGWNDARGIYGSPGA
jgi:hypothetical protein